MDEQSSGSIEEKAPLTFLLAKWYGYILAGVFLLYGGVSLILSVLDRDYSQTGKFLVFLAVGIVLAAIAMAFRDRRPWGWYGQLGLQGLVVVLALFHPTNPYNWILIALSLASLWLLWTPRTKGEIF
jgi:hypothetical protein